MSQSTPLVGITMGSESDWPVMKDVTEILRQFDVSFEVRVLSAHRTPDATHAWASGAADRGMKVMIAGAGGAAHLAGVVAAATHLPVIGVPMPSKHLQGIDSLLATVQMPKGVPVATVAVGGAANAGLLAVQILATADPQLAERMATYKRDMIGRVDEMNRRVSDSLEQ